MAWPKLSLLEKQLNKDLILLRNEALPSGCEGDSQGH